MLYLFGSRKDGRSRPDSDVDVFIDGDADDARANEMVERLAPYAIENGGYLDLFWAGDDLWSAYDPDGMRMIVVDRWNRGHLAAATPISEEEVAALCTQLLASHGRYRGKPRDAP
jgi:hypothetical protein